MDEIHLFGEIAIAKGYVTAEQVRAALGRQQELARGHTHRLVGVLLVELGFMTPDQVIEVLETADAEREQGIQLRTA